ncbi:alpha/beta hydrolase [Actinoplanes awajinensis]|uniref:Xylanase n=1 Tax=Actinoplanes awajinensis subsp. mycoplanecinus TaxID=135947 RepID=A0A101JQ06_9ACTN|nr:alpha/beta hydrolase [Actinoplanes awajinensis]KUL30901.1 xylanase [Actinoplanes awajinensis subsp. mycoplanecinus]
MTIDTTTARRDHADGALDITTYPADRRFTGPRPAVLVFPGGGYRFHAGHEGEGYARWLSGIGLHAFVLRYPLMTDHRFPAPLEAGRAALDWIRAGEHGLDVGEHVGVIGSSAGGHIAGLLATGTVMSAERLDAAPPRPDFAILAYAVADLHLLPDAPVSFVLDGRMELRDELSPARNIDAATCPTFLWATAEDPPGFPNALAYASALFAAGIPVELHIYPRGQHGLGLANGVAYGDHGEIHIPHTARWAENCAAWLGAEGFLAS